MTKSSVNPYIRLSMTLCLVALLLGSCSDETVVNTIEPQASLRATLTLSLGSAVTRADTSTVAGTDYENYIDPSRLTVCIFEGGGADNSGATYSQSFVAKDVMQSVTNPQLYYVTGDLAEAPTPPFKVLVLANWGTLAAPALVQGQTTIDDLTCFSGLYAYTKSFTPSAATPIPMFGIRTYDTFRIVVDKDADLGNITLTRGMAKIIVKSHDSTLADVKLTRCHNLGLSAPYGIYQYTAYSDDGNLNIPSDRADLTFPSGYTLQTLTDVPLQERTVEGWSKWYELYVPEYRNTGVYASDRVNGGTVEPAQISFSLQGQALDVAFIDYDTDKPFNIYRNFRYEYHVEKTHIRYQVLPIDTISAAGIHFD